MERRELAGVGFSGSLPARHADDWGRATGHPFIVAAGDGTLPAERFHVWVRQDRHFVMGLRGFVGRLLEGAPGEDRDGLRSGLAALDPELELFSAYALREGVDLLGPPFAVCTNYLSFLTDCASRGYADGLTAYYACERAYLDAWSTVKEAAAGYREWVENWTSDAFRAYVDWLGERIDAIAIGLDDDRLEKLSSIFGQVVRYETEFWDACLA